MDKLSKESKEYLIKREINEEASFEIDDLIHATRIARSTLEDYLIQE